MAAAAAIADDDVATADAHLHRLSGRPSPDPLLHATVAVARARFTKDVGPALEQLEKVWTGPSGNPDLDLYAMYQLGVARLYVGRYQEGRDALESAERIAEGAGRDALRMSCLSFLAGSYASLNQYNSMREYAQRAVTLAERSGWSHSQVAAHTHMLISWGNYQQAQWRACLEHAEKACAALGPHSEPDVELAARSALTLAKDAVGILTVDDLTEIVAHIHRLSDASMSPAVMSNGGPPVVRMCLRLGSRSQAREVAAQVQQYAPDPGESALIRAMILLDSGQPAPARKALEAITSGSAACHSVVTEVSALTLSAVLDATEARDSRAHANLNRALELSAPLGLREPFVSRPRVIELLIANEGRFGRLNDFAKHVVDLAQREQRPPAAIALTPGEQAVLRELPSLLSVREIAERRHVSVNTLKAQMRSVYRKLGVNGRRQAVEAARLQHLL